MCGIAGFINAPATEGQQRQWLDAMTATLAHRGPDGQGAWVEGGVALGHRRLSVIDLEGGQQPMLDWQGRAVIVFNGEIYNFLEIKARLERKGYRFRTQSDTEVLLNAYLDAGPGLPGLRGGYVCLRHLGPGEADAVCRPGPYGRETLLLHAAARSFRFCLGTDGLFPSASAESGGGAPKYLPAFWPMNTCRRRRASTGRSSSSDRAIF